MARVLGTCLVWAVGTWFLYALGILGWELLGEAAASSALRISTLLESTLADLLARPRWSAIALGAGATLGLLSLVPAVIRQNGERVLAWTLFGVVSGGLSAALVAFIYLMVDRMLGGVSPDRVSLLDLLTREPLVVAVVPYGGIGGGVLAVVLVVTGLLREAEAAAEASRRLAASMRDPDTLIRAARARRAEAYLSGRGSSGQEVGVEP